MTWFWPNFKARFLVQQQQQQKQQKQQQQQQPQRPQQQHQLSWVMTQSNLKSSFVHFQSKFVGERMTLALIWVSAVKKYMGSFSFVSSAFPTINTMTLTHSMWMAMSLTITHSLFPQLSHPIFQHQFSETQTLLSPILELLSPQEPSVGFQ